MIRWLTSTVAQYHDSREGAGRETILRRLNAREYRNTIRDLLHVNMTMFDPTEKFPMDLSWLSGVVAEEHLRRSRPEVLPRLQAAGELEELRTVTPQRRRRRQIMFWGGLLLLAGMCTLFVVVLVNLGQ